MSTQLLLIVNLLSVVLIIITAQVYDVIITGAGPAGIAAAIDLKKSLPEISLIILEARNRVGGRVLTDTQTFKHNVSADVGAEWIHAYGPKNPLYHIHKQLQPVEEQCRDEVFVLFEPTVTGCYDSTGASVSRSMCKQAQDTMHKLFSPTYNSVLDYEDISVRDMIRPEYQKIPEGQLKRLIDAMLIGREEYEAADLEWISARQAFFGDSPGDDQEQAGDNLALQHGYGTLMQRIVKQYALPVELNTVVVRIVTSDANEIRISTDKDHIFRSKLVLVTVPLGCLKRRSIVFEPSLPSWKLKAIDSMGFGDTDKIILQFDRVFWDPKWTSFYIAGSPFPFAICAPRKRILVFMIGGTRARRMEVTSDEVTIASILQQLRNIFQYQNFKLERYRISRWSQDPYAAGSYSYYALNTSLATFNVLAKECFQNRLFWAGEHTSAGGSVHTAFATGQREAKNILHRLK